MRFGYFVDTGIRRDDDSQESFVCVCDCLPILSHPSSFALCSTKMAGFYQYSWKCVKGKLKLVECCPVHMCLCALYRDRMHEMRKGCNKHDSLAESIAICHHRGLCYLCMYNQTYLSTYREITFHPARCGDSAVRNGGAQALNNHERFGDYHSQDMPFPWQTRLNE